MFEGILFNSNFQRESFIIFSWKRRRRGGKGKRTLCGTRGNNPWTSENKSILGVSAVLALLRVEIRAHVYRVLVYLTFGIIYSHNFPYPYCNAPMPYGSAFIGVLDCLVYIFFMSTHCHACSEYETDSYHPLKYLHGRVVASENVFKHPSQTVAA